MNDPRQKIRFQQKLLAWYEVNRRELPWRINRDPYRVWISEIMLQQTRVAAVIPHYCKFLKRFPSVARLAAARESSVLALWSGLGYYRRARMLHAASKTVMKHYAGKVPDNKEEFGELPGVGRYTCSAVASIAFDEPVAVVDGNVRRVLQRLKGKAIADEELWQVAGQLLCRERPGDYNQALMELGATVCLPREPKCQICPITRECASRGPLDGTKNRREKLKRRICYTLNRRTGRVFMIKRPPDARLMPGMWELPEVAESNKIGDPFIRLRHSITITDLEVMVTQGATPAITDGKWIKESCLRVIPLTGLARKILRAADVI
jgi:A/G-specific adenine glycosylase